MTVILTGFMGTGKTTIGQRLAERLGKEFVDTDACIEQQQGRSVASIFASNGEANFRALERRIVAQAVQKDAVVATGGGAIVDPATLERMRAAGPIICLTADVEVIVQRTAANNERPLLDTADRRERISQLLHERAPAYAQADMTVDTSHRSVEAILDDIVVFLQRRQDRHEEGQR